MHMVDRSWFNSHLVTLIGIILLVMGLAGLISGPIPYLPIPSLATFHKNISPELVGIGITVLLIDWANGKREDELEKKLEKKDLILHMSSPDNVIAQEAVRTLRARGWLFDDTLKSANLIGANLANTELTNAKLNDANLTKANLQNAILNGIKFNGAILHRTNLQNADFTNAAIEHAKLNSANLQNAKNTTNEQFRKAFSLHGATMPTGKLYNGRFNLDGDLMEAHLMKIGHSDDAKANYYGVSVEVYRWGQEWNKYYQSPPVMYSPDLPRWYELNENPDGKV